jgi:putative ABC transport system permease protein
VISVRHVSADYFKTMRIPLRAGRTFAESDAAGAEAVAIINESAAKKYFPGVDPVGRHVANSGDDIMRRIVGVVGDVRYDGPTRSGQEELYLPYRQVPWAAMSIVVRSDQRADVVARALRAEITRIDRDQAMTDIRTMDSVVSATTTQQQFTTSLLGTFALLATGLAAIGLYGVVALFVSQRRHEFGVRMALGARRVDVLLLAMREGVTVILAGAVVGVAGALLGSQALSGLLFGVTATRPSAYAGGVAVLVGIGLIASYVPARRATAVDPARALRAE